MIRVNLLPRRREAKSGEGGRAWIAVIAAVFLLEVIAIIVVHAQKKHDLDQQVAVNADLERGIADKRGRVANHESVKAQLADYQARENAIAKLQSGRTGPTAMMLELSRILTPGKSPTVDPEVYEKLRRDNPAALPSDHWDPHRLWLISFKEQPTVAGPAPGAPPGVPPPTGAVAVAERLVTMTGIGKTNDDVAEFMRRLTVSRYFADVKLVKTEEKTDKEATAGIAATTFEMRAKVRY